MKSSPNAPTLASRYRGALLGLATGDALGTTVEFKPPGSFEPLTDMVGGGPFRLKPGQWTDDTSMALCLAESLLECNGFDAVDQMQRYVRWNDEGHWSSTGSCFDIGGATSSALRAFRRTGNGFSGSTDSAIAGNGSLMRLVPIPLFFARDPELALRMAADSSRTTHGSATAVDACRYFAGLIIGALGGASKEELLSERYSPLPTPWGPNQLHLAVTAIASGSFRGKQASDVRASGFVLHTLEAALWAFATTDDFASGALAAVNLGDDADTTGAVYGQLAGTFYGLEGIPARWVEKLSMRQEIWEMADRLHTKATSEGSAMA